jgi:hypothetical protein
MLISKTVLLINVAVIAVMIAVVSASSYGLGMNQNNQASAAYQSATSFLAISVILTIVSICSLIGLTLLSTGWTGSVVVGINTPGASPSFLNTPGYIPVPQ